MPSRLWRVDTSSFTHTDDDNPSTHTFSFKSVLGYDDRYEQYYQHMKLKDELSFCTLEPFSDNSSPCESLQSSVLEIIS